MEYYCRITIVSNSELSAFNRLEAITWYLSRIVLLLYAEIDRDWEHEHEIAKKSMFSG